MKFKFVKIYPSIGGNIFQIICGLFLMGTGLYGIFTKPLPTIMLVLVTLAVIYFAICTIKIALALKDKIKQA
ncbi:hypothetical protein M3M39_01555 [Fructilactobacillus hinvesii]|uniref:Uncharacterized protein n=1 Tax=Fructilactobacillus hinvesii TaxID=2940300 RepID=A0ABY5BSU8_9LACO|nr:hypothetical protein [Fructilactobacillus hinvesii]USS88194.1 hypothetical protein M3M39_01555 [Fructilactobacillus hinvesii]